MFSILGEPQRQVVSMHRDARGFTLIEILIVVAIIAILSAIALPAYNGYRTRSAESACLAEMRNYAGVSLAVIRNGDTPEAAPQQACANADDATAVGANITGTPQQPGNRQTQCNMTTGDCQLQ
ncbi:hypothetical protein ASD77_09475 [Pseudoxanthomonas sp. Root65]|nr:hypothetical protein ASD77_09475 [Pseudoxanthomonas sp. Root65]